MQIKKILNNNAAVILSVHGQESIVTGKGIAFQKKAGDRIDAKQIEKTFTLKGKDTNNRFQELVTEIPIQHIIVCEKIIRYAKLNLGKILSDTIYITLTDHISTAIQRYQEGIALKNALLWDIRQFYADEFQMGLKAIDIVKAELGVDFLEDEAAFIALHFVNAELDEDMSMVHDMTKLIQEITSIIKYHFQIDYSAQGQAYYRFINHLKCFAQRLFHKTGYEDDDDAVFLEAVKEKNPREHQCAQVIANYIKQQYAYQMSNEEILYFTVHITRIIRESRRS